MQVVVSFSCVKNRNFPPKVVQSNLAKNFVGQPLHALAVRSALIQRPADGGHRTAQHLNFQKIFLKPFFRRRFLTNFNAPYIHNILSAEQPSQAEIQFNAKKIIANKKYSAAYKTVGKKEYLTFLKKLKGIGKNSSTKYQMSNEFIYISMLESFQPILPKN